MDLALALAVSKRQLKNLDIGETVKFDVALERLHMFSHGFHCDHSTARTARRGLQCEIANNGAHVHYDHIGRQRDPIPAEVGIENRGFIDDA